ncbi:MAG TPA: M28 family peptidase, partial [Flavisolibacter sp.]
SDHFNFAKVGIPALYTARGIEIEGKDAGYGKKADEDYRAQHYHRPSDEFRNDWSMDGAIEDLRLLFIVGKRLAFSSAWPSWKAGSEFKAMRDSVMKKQ